GLRKDNCPRSHKNRRRLPIDRAFAMMTETECPELHGSGRRGEIDRSEGKVMETEERKKLIAELAAERDELERKAAELDRQGQRLKDRIQNRALWPEGRTFPDYAQDR